MQNQRIAERGSAFIRKYLNTQGLSTEQSEIFNRMLLDLYQTTGSQWRPRKCRNIPPKTPYALQAYESSKMSVFFKPPVAKRFASAHFFWALDQYETTHVLIIDPTGVPEQFPQGIEGNILAYFGLRQYAPSSHRCVYERAKDMDEWGTREFPQGFHP